jgi:hypothetical protein
MGQFNARVEKEKRGQVVGQLVEEQNNSGEILRETCDSRNIKISKTIFNAVTYIKLRGHGKLDNQNLSLIML